MAVWIEGGDEHELARTRDALGRGTSPPIAILGGPLQRALGETRVGHVLLVRAGDVPAVLALERLGQAAAMAPDASIITCDDDALDRSGSRCSPRFRPGPSPDYWLARDDSGPMLLVSREAALAHAGELRGGLAWRHELAIELAGRAGERHAHVPVILCHRSAHVQEAPVLDPDTVASIIRRQEPGTGVRATDSGRVVDRTIHTEPSVEVIVCFRDRPELLERCVTSLLSMTRYDRLGLVLVDNGSQEARTADLLSRWSASPQIRVIKDDRAFNFAALNNRAAFSSSADVLVFLNNDTAVVQEDWLTPLLEEAVREEVGAVGPMLLYPGGQVQHAGVALGLHDYAGHPFAGLPPRANTPFGSPAGGTRNWLAVTAACMVIQRAKFLSVGAFDPSFVVGGNDVDLCLRLTTAGYRSLCVPRVTLLHDESQSRGTHIDPGDFLASERSYGLFRTVGDPFYNPNLTLRATDCSVRIPEPA